MKHADGCSEQILDEVSRTVFNFNFNIWYVHLLQQLQQHISQ